MLGEESGPQPRARSKTSLAGLGVGQRLCAVKGSVGEQARLSVVTGGHHTSTRRGLRARLATSRRSRVASLGLAVAAAMVTRVEVSQAVILSKKW